MKTMMLTVITAAVVMVAAPAVAAEGDARRVGEVFAQGEIGLSGLRVQGSATAADLDAVAEGRISLPFSASQLRTVYRLMRLNVNIWSKVGWDAGRLIARNKGLPDPGPWPGAAVALRLKKG